MASQRRQVHVTVAYVDHPWAAAKLKEFLAVIDDYIFLALSAETEYPDEEQAEGYDAVLEKYGSQQNAADRLTSLSPVMGQLMDAAQPGLGDYAEAEGGWSYTDESYWRQVVRPRVLRAIGIHELGEEARLRMKPDSPDLAADQFHPWVWEAASPLWRAESKQEAVLAACRSVNARMQQKGRRRDTSEAALCREFFSPADPAPGRPRLRVRGYTPGDPTWRSRQQGAMEFGAGCFEAIRNPAAHEHGLVLTEQVALEQLAALSLLARWIDEAEVETAAQ